MKPVIEDHKGTEAEGRYKITLTYGDGSKEILKNTQLLDLWQLTWCVDHCEIRSFKVELDTTESEEKAKEL